MRTELEKMLAGELYDASDATRAQMRYDARARFVRFNQLPHDAEPERRAALEEMLGHVGKNVNIQPPFYCDYGTFISIGDNGFMNFNCTFLDCAHITIGDNFQCAAQCAALCGLSPRHCVGARQRTGTGRAHCDW